MEDPKIKKILRRKSDPNFQMRLKKYLELIWDIMADYRNDSLSTRMPPISDSMGTPTIDLFEWADMERIFKHKKIIEIRLDALSLLEKELKSIMEVGSLSGVGPAAMTLDGPRDKDSHRNPPRKKSSGPKRMPSPPRKNL